MTFLDEAAVDVVQLLHVVFFVDLLLVLFDFHWSTAISTRPVVCATDIEGMLFPATPSAVHLSAPECTLIIKEC